MRLQSANLKIPASTTGFKKTAVCLGFGGSISEESSYINSDLVAILKKVERKLVVWVVKASIDSYV